MNTLILMMLSMMSLSEPAETVDLKIVVTNISKIQGNIELGIFNSQKSFLEIGKQYKSMTKQVTNNTVIFTFLGVAKDNYAVSVFHDRNSDKICNLNFIGMPTEPYGFSQNYKPKLRKPTFDDCKFNAQTNVSINIKLID